MLAILHRVAARVRAWCRRSPAEASTTVVTAPALAPPSPPTRKRSNLPLLWTAKCSDTLKWWCGPVAVATIIGVDVAAVRDVIRRCRNGRAVKGTYANELQFAFRHFGYDMRLLADLRGNPPTLVTWARERVDMQAAYHQSLGRRARPVVLRQLDPRRASQDRRRAAPTQASAVRLRGDDRGAGATAARALMRMPGETAMLFWIKVAFWIVEAICLWRFYREITRWRRPASR
jgi:hypothetical protein